MMFAHMYSNVPSQLSSHRRAGFTLVEVSIVLVIIGLVIGGVLVGRDMINNARVLRVGSEVEKYRAAILAFKTKYHALPGDLENAFSYWSDTAACGTNTNNSWVSCNGDGDGIINFPPEGIIMWRHLSLAGLIQQTFRRDTGGSQPYTASDCGVGAHGACPSGTLPEAPIPKAGFEVAHTGETMHNSSGANPEYALYGYKGHVIMMGRNSLGVSSQNSGPSLTVAEAMMLDGKLDDGLPNKGSVLATSTHNVPAHCVSSGAYWYARSNVASTWMIQNEGVNCLMFFKAEF